VSQHQYLLYGIKHTKTIKKNLWLYTAVVLLMMGANSIPKHVELKNFQERNKAYSASSWN
jgi:hypothetical protein